jgi:protocatechuate 3,4-dioxygenase beta subunit
MTRRHPAWSRKGNRKAYERRALLEALEDRRLLTTLGTMEIAQAALDPGLWGVNSQIDSLAPHTGEAGVIRVTRTGGTYAGLPALNERFGTMCLELNQFVGSKYDVVGLTDGPNPGDLGVGAMSSTTADYLRELWGQDYASIGTDSVKGAAFQLAVWEIVHDSRPWDLSSGTFSVLPGNANVTSAVSTATAMLSSVDGQGPKATLLMLTNSLKQDVIFEVPPAELGDFVWEDTNGNGQQDAGEPGIAGVKVDLSGAGLDGVFGTGDDTSGSQLTASNGKYLFKGLMPGKYQVQFTAPGGYGFTATDAGSDLSDSDADGAGLTGVYTLVSNESNLTVDAGLHRPASLGDYVWHDLNANGVQDAGEPGIAGVTVTLSNGATTTTDASGFYQFTGLVPGNYSVSFPAPSGYIRTTADAGSDDAVDSDANVVTGQTGAYVLKSGDSDLTADAGYYRLASLGDRVWVDANANGIQDSGETGLGGVVVKLYSGSTLVGTTSTDANGNYLFSGLMPGSYSVQFVAASGYVFSPRDQGANDAVDSDADAISGSTGSYTLVSGQLQLTVDAGLRKTGEVVHHGLAATIGFWQNKNGQALLKSLNGGPTATALGNWLGTAFPNLYGASACANNLLGKSNSYIASFFVSKFKLTGMKLQAQVLAVAFGVYATNSTLAGGAMAAKYGFEVSTGGLGAATYNIGSSGAAFGVPNNSVLTVMEILTATNARSTAGVLYNGNWALSVLANSVYDGINNAGDII